jgi:anti-sigma factor RsiW
MQDPTLSRAQPHHDAEELIPWYLTGQLDDEDLAMVEHHLSSCAHCRRQLAAERRMIDEFAQLSPQIDSGWARLRQRIDVPQPRERLWDKLRGQAAELWESLSRPAIATLAVAQLAFVVAAGAILLSLGQPDYRTLGSAPAPASANVIAMFRAETTEAQLRDLLQSNGASLVDGPTAGGAYLLRVQASSRPQVVARLRGDRHVLMAQPIDGPAS